jgi:hypothetical protein
MEVTIKLGRKEVLDCCAFPYEGKTLPEEYSSKALLGTLQHLGVGTHEEVLRWVRIYLMELDIPLGKYRIILEQVFGQSKKTTIYEVF